MFWKNLSLGIVFFALTPVALATSIFTLLSLSQKPSVPAKTTGSTLGVQIYASLPTTFPTVSGSAGVADARVEIIRQYMLSYKSPLAPFADKLVEMADKYGLDFRLLTAIAQQESNLCKIIPPGTHNCWGWGIHSQGTLGFDSYEEGIETVSKGLKENYADKGLVSPNEIMTRYTPHSPEGAWARGVNTFMAAMQ